ncbi:Striatin family-domain-containing protein [Myxozyma melibiosi]|uniref:Striatin family-domain-containing protein n=1 Tax=Myxozyma melibiosi TaxID=54550 RepID=A0ABR1F0M4_9ASCO
MSGAANGHAPQPEYTLQGVMRFLQSEWQKNERYRIQWEIEKAEMKARIARLEGEKRGTEKLVESYVKRITMLERALAEERSKASGTAPAPADSKTTEKKADPEEFSSELETAATSEPFINSKAYIEETEKRRLKSRQYLEKCLQEVTYLLVFADNIPLQSSALPESQQQPNSSYAAAVNGSGAHSDNGNRQQQQQRQGEGALPPQYEANPGRNGNGTNDRMRQSAPNSSTNNDSSSSSSTNNNSSRVIIFKENASENGTGNTAAGAATNNGAPRITAQAVEITDADADRPVAIGEPLVSSTIVSETDGWDDDDRPRTGAGTSGSSTRTIPL